MTNKYFKIFQKRVLSSKKNGDSVFFLHSNKLGIHSEASIINNIFQESSGDIPLHFASIGKTLTSVLISILFEKGLIKFDDYITKYLDSNIVNGLNIYKSIDYSNSVKIWHLLNHTSGIADYYMDKNSDGKRLIDFMLSEPEHFWEPLETINYTKENLKSHFAPGKCFHYSDTNYQLLGFIIEKISSKPLHEVLKEFIFSPLKMENTYQIFYSEPKVKSDFPMAKIYHNEQDLTQFKSISLSWASGGTVSTANDMYKFHKALVENTLISCETFNKMQDWARFGPGIRYGYALMNFRFPLMPRKYEIWGNSGSIGTYMYYNPAMDAYLIGTFNNINYQVQPIMFIISILRQISKEIKKR